MRTAVAWALQRPLVMPPWSSQRDASREARSAGRGLAMVYAAGVFAVVMVVYLIVFLIRGR